MNGLVEYLEWRKCCTNVIALLLLLPLSLLVTYHVFHHSNSSTIILSFLKEETISHFHLGNYNNPFIQQMFLWNSARHQRNSGEQDRYYLYFVVLTVQEKDN